MDNIIFEITLNPDEYNFGIDLKVNIYQPGDKQLPHGPRVKMHRQNQPSRNFEISLNIDPLKIKLVAGSYKNIIKDRDFYLLLSKIKKYRIPLLNTWYNQKMKKKDVIYQMNLIDNCEIVELFN